MIIEADNIIKTYDAGAAHVAALRGVTLSVDRGEMVSIMGPSGCGKTTFLNCASGLDSIDSGTVRVSGTDLNALTDHAKTAFRAREMGFVFQFYNLLPVLSAVENVELPLIVSGVGVKEARRRALAALKQVGLADWANRRPAQLSGGQRQRVTIARALINNPAIVWADEPTGDLDSAMAGEVMSLMERMNRDQAQTFVIVTHDEAIARRCHRVVHMRDGRIEGESWGRTEGG